MWMERRLGRKVLFGILQPRKALKSLMKPRKFSGTDQKCTNKLSIVQINWSFDKNENTRDLSMIIPNLNYFDMVIEMAVTETL